MDELFSVEEVFAGNNPAQTALDRRTRRAARCFMHHLGDRHGPVRSLVYGSRARGDDRDDSDLDLAVILMGLPGNRWGLAREMARVAFDVLMETDVLVDPLPLWENELAQPELFGNPSLLHPT